MQPKTMKLDEYLVVNEPFYQVSGNELEVFEPFYRNGLPVLLKGPAGCGRGLYRGEYGIEDTRRALVEARRQGIQPYCIMIDEEARDYQPHLYAPAAYTRVDEVSALPLKVSDMYRRLTT